MTTPFGRRAATINMVIVDERMRGRGLGRQLMIAAIQAAGDRECRLIATEAGLPLSMKRWAFARSAPSRSTRARPLPIPPWRGMGSRGRSNRLSGPHRMDRDACGMDREALIARLAAAGQVATLNRHGQLAGFAILSPFGRGEVIGPVVAPAAADAKALLAFIIAARPGAFLRVDTLESSGLVPWLNERGLARAGGGVAITLGGLPPQPTRPFHTFALATFSADPGDLDAQQLPPRTRPRSLIHPVASYRGHERTGVRVLRSAKGATVTDATGRRASGRRGAAGRMCGQVQRAFHRSIRRSRRSLRAPDTAGRASPSRSR